MYNTVCERLLCPQFLTFHFFINMYNSLVDIKATDHVLATISAIKV